MDGVKEQLYGRLRRRCRLPSCKGCCTTCVKTTLLLFNFSFLICGLSAVAVGLWLHVYRDLFYFRTLLQGNLNSSSKADTPSQPAVLGPTAAPGRMAPISFDSIPFLLIGIGGFVACMSFLGCCGACVESVCFLGFYTLTTVFIVVAEIIGGSVSTSLINQMSDRLLVNMQQQIRMEYNFTAQRWNQTTPDNYKLTLAWDTLQIQMGCCGALGPKDYTFSSWFNHTKEYTGVFVPTSCCALLNDDPKRPRVRDDTVCQIEAILVQEDTQQPITQLNKQGCHQTLSEWFYGYERRVISILCLVILLQMFNLIFACMLIGWVRKKHSDISWCESDEYCET